MKKRLLGLGIVLVCLSGCAALGEGVKKTTDTVFGTPPPSSQAVENVANNFPFPWNLLVTALGSAGLGVWGYQYRRRLLETPPPTKPA